MQNSQESLTYKADGGGSLPEFLAIFGDFFVIFFRPKKLKRTISQNYKQLFPSNFLYRQGGHPTLF